MIRNGGNARNKAGQSAEFGDGDWRANSVDIYNVGVLIWCFVCILYVFVHFAFFILIDNIKFANIIYLVLLTGLL